MRTPRRSLGPPIAQHAVRRHRPHEGLPFTENPCVAGQVDWVRDRSKPPTATRWPASRRARSSAPTAPGPVVVEHPRGAALERRLRRGEVRRRDPEPDRLEASGDLDRRRARLSRASHGRRARGRSASRTATSSRGSCAGCATRVRLRAVLERLGVGVDHGPWRLPGVPVWATAGALDYPNGALDRCTQPSFSGGRVYLSQWWTTTLDYDPPARPTPSTAARPAVVAVQLDGDFNGDWKNDVLARWTSSAVLKLYRRHWHRQPRRRADRHRVGLFNVLDTVGDLAATATSTCSRGRARRATCGCTRATAGAAGACPRAGRHRLADHERHRRGG